jgi:hypothetical protein
VLDLGGTLLHYHDPDSDEPQRPFRRITMIGVGQLVHALNDQGFGTAFGAAVDHHIGHIVQQHHPSW